MLRYLYSRNTFIYFALDFLGQFPPKSVQLKRPFAIQPWMNSEENIGNLLMVWRFLITFADILELWPFTLDEFVQAFHDYVSDPRVVWFHFLHLKFSPSHC